MDISIPHRVIYDFDGRATVAEVARALVAQERLVRDALGVLEKIFPELTFDAPRVEIRAVSQESPLRTHMEAIAVAAYAPALGEDMPDLLNALFGIDVPDRYDSIVSVLVLLIAIWGIDWVREKLFPGKKDTEIKAEKERLAAVAADKASVTQSQIEDALEAVLSRRKTPVMKAATGFLAPAKAHAARAIKVPADRSEKRRLKPSHLTLILLSSSPRPKQPSWRM